MSFSTSDMALETLQVVVKLMLVAGGALLAALAWMSRRLIACLQSNTEQSKVMTDAMRAQTDYIRQVKGGTK